MSTEKSDLIFFSTLYVIIIRNLSGELIVCLSATKDGQFDYEVDGLCVVVPLKPDLARYVPS